MDRLRQFRDNFLGAYAEGLVEALGWFTVIAFVLVVWALIRLG